jgi:hypothetical protein
MSQPPEQKPPPPRWTLGAVALIVLGLLILIPSGLCTAAMGIASIGSLFSSFGGFSSAIMGLFGTLILGGPFVALGAFLIYTGWRRGAPK